MNNAITFEQATAKYADEFKDAAKAETQRELVEAERALGAYGNAIPGATTAAEKCAKYAALVKAGGKPSREVGDHYLFGPGFDERTLDTVEFWEKEWNRNMRDVSDYEDGIRYAIRKIADLRAELAGAPRQADDPRPFEERLAAAKPRTALPSWGDVVAVLVLVVVVAGAMALA